MCVQIIHTIINSLNLHYHSMQTCVNPDCETIHLSNNLKKCSVCGHPFEDYDVFAHLDLS
jgi:hypothetical protein